MLVSRLAPAIDMKLASILGRLPIVLARGPISGMRPGTVAAVVARRFVLLIASHVSRLIAPSFFVLAPALGVQGSATPLRNRLGELLRALRTDFDR